MHEHNANTQNRIAWIDAARGYAILLVMFAHTSIPSTLFSYIYSFHVPLFFILSGLLLNGNLNKPFSDFIKIKIYRLIVPYFFFSAIVYVYWLLEKKINIDSSSHSISSSVPLNGIFIAIRDSSFMAPNAALWFICGLFFAEITFYLLYRLIRGDRQLLTISLVGLLVIGSLYNTFIHAPLPWSIDTIPFVVVFIGVGFILKDYYQFYLQKMTMRQKILLLFSAVTSSILAWHFNQPQLGRTDMYYSSYGVYALYFLGSIMGSIVVMIFFEYSMRYMKDKYKMLTFIGQNSLIIYALHQKVLFGIVSIIFLSFFHTVTPFSLETSLDKAANGISYVLLALLLALPFTLFFNKRMKFFVGRTKVLRFKLEQKLLDNHTLS